MCDEGKTKEELISEVRELRRQAETGFERTNAYLENVFENSPDPIGIVDAHGKFIMWNKMAAVLYGYSFEEMLGKSAFDLYADEDELRTMLKCLRREGSVKKYEIRMKKKDGTILPCELSIGLLREGRKRSLGSVCVARDLSDIKKVLAELKVTNEQLLGVIADRKKVEEELNEYRSHLEDLVRERTAELGEANKRLRLEIEERKQAEDALKFFAYSIAHDLKSPTIGILGLTKLIQKQYGNAIDDKCNSYFNQIIKVSEQIAEFVEKLNTYIASKKNDFYIEQINAIEIVKAVREEFSEKLTDRKIGWFEPDCEVEIAADRLSILRIFRNLVDNSLKYGGACLSEIRIEYVETEAFHIFSVTDNGMGLEGVDPDRLFGLFQRYETARGTEGAGLGLAIVKEIAERHGGKAWVEPRVERGARFCISISKNL